MSFNYQTYDVAGHFDVDAAGMRAELAVQLEERMDFAEDLVEGPRLVAVAGLDGVAVHRIAAPDDGAAG